MAAGIAKEGTDRINLTMGLPSKLGVFVLGGGLLVFLTVTYLLKKYTK